MHIQCLIVFLLERNKIMFREVQFNFLAIITSSSSLPHHHYHHHYRYHRTIGNFVPLINIILSISIPSHYRHLSRLEKQIHLSIRGPYVPPLLRILKFYLFLIFKKQYNLSQIIYEINLCRMIVYNETSLRFGPRNDFCGSDSDKCCPPPPLPPP